MIKDKVWKIVEDSKKDKGVLKAFNAKFLTLIPREDGADSPGKFRPIALCNAIYKIITKVVANKLKPILLDLLTNEQSGFMEGGEILDGIILVNEVIHSLKVKIKRYVVES